MLELFKTNRKKATMSVTLYNVKKKLLKKNKNIFSVITTKYMDDGIADYRITMKGDPINYIYFFVDKHFKFTKFNQITIGHLSMLNNLGKYYKNRLLKKDGMILHVLLNQEKFDDTFATWGTEIKKYNGISLAHVAAKHDALPDSFDQWGIKDNNGRSIAHVAAMYRSLPPNFSSWNLTDNDGIRVFDIYRKLKAKSVL